MSESNNNEQHSRPPPSGDSPSENGNPRATRNITVSIHYSYITPGAVPTVDPAPIPNGTTAAATTTTTATLPGNRADGALVLSFRDVPESTPQERLDSIISIAAELAMRRFSDILNQPKGISKEEFESLPVLRLADLPKGSDPTCSICYEPFEEDAVKASAKRAREEEEEEEDEGTSTKKCKTAESSNLESNSARNETNTNPTSITSFPSETNHGESETSYNHTPVKLPCDHIFGRSCIYKWSQQDNTCPLCRHSIIDRPSGPSVQPDNTANNNEAFERIRQIIYNTDPHEGRPATSAAAAAATTNTVPNTEQNANNPLGIDNNVLSMSRSGVVFLRPMSQRGASTTANSPLANNERNTDAHQPHWVPIPLTMVHLDTNLHPNANTTETRPDGNTSAAGNEPADNSERVRSILDHVFNVTRGGQPAATQPTTANTTQTRETPPNRLDRSSFIQSILRIVSPHRNEATSGTTPQPQPLFATGVASYRDQNGHVTSYNINSNGHETSTNPNNDSTLNENDINDNNSNEAPSEDNSTQGGLNSQ